MRKSHPGLVDGAMEFLDTNGEVLAFIRGEGSDRLLFVFNLDRSPVEWAVPSDLDTVEVVRLPGFAPGHDQDTVMLAGLDVFCARLS